MSKAESQLCKDVQAFAKTFETLGVKCHTFDEMIDNIEVGLDDKRQTVKIFCPNEVCEDSEIRLKVMCTSKKFRQLVLCIEEPARTVERAVNVKFDTKYSQQELRDSFSVGMPSGTKYTQKKQTKTWSIVTAKAPKSSVYLLIGYDEKHLFVSMLPKKASSVKEAHEILMPKAVKGVKGVIRQGEFFFLPVTQKELKEVELQLQKGNCEAEIDIYDTDHLASLGVETAHKKFVHGVISNDRHYTFLPTWHKVVMNTELPGGDSWD